MSQYMPYLEGNQGHFRPSEVDSGLPLPPAPLLPSDPLPSISDYPTFNPPAGNPLQQVPQAYQENQESQGQQHHNTRDPTTPPAQKMQLVQYGSSQDQFQAPITPTNMSSQSWEEEEEWPTPDLNHEPQHMSFKRPQSPGMYADRANKRYQQHAPGMMYGMMRGGHLQYESHMIHDGFPPGPSSGHIPYPPSVYSSLPNYGPSPSYALAPVYASPPNYSFPSNYGYSGYHPPQNLPYPTRFHDPAHKIRPIVTAPYFTPPQVSRQSYTPVSEPVRRPQTVGASGGHHGLLQPRGIPLTPQNQSPTAGRLGSYLSTPAARRSRQESQPSRTIQPFVHPRTGQAAARAPVKDNGQHSHAENHQQPREVRHAGIVSAFPIRRSATREYATLGGPDPYWNSIATQEDSQETGPGRGRSRSVAPQNVNATRRRRSHSQDIESQRPTTFQHLRGRAQSVAPQDVDSQGPSMALHSQGRARSVAPNVAINIHNHQTHNETHHTVDNRQTYQVQTQNVDNRQLQVGQQFGEHTQHSGREIQDGMQIQLASKPMTLIDQPPQTISSTNQNLQIIKHERHQSPTAINSAAMISAERPQASQALSLPSGSTDSSKGEAVAAEYHQTNNLEKTLAPDASVSQVKEPLQVQASVPKRVVPVEAILGHQKPYQHGHRRAAPKMEIESTPMEHHFRQTSASVRPPMVPFTARDIIPKQGIFSKGGATQEPDGNSKIHDWFSKRTTDDPPNIACTPPPSVVTIDLTNSDDEPEVTYVPAVKRSKPMNQRIAPLPKKPTQPANKSVSQKILGSAPKKPKGASKPGKRRATKWVENPPSDIDRIGNIRAARILIQRELEVEKAKQEMLDEDLFGEIIGTSLEEQKRQAEEKASLQRQEERERKEKQRVMEAEREAAAEAEKLRLQAEALEHAAYDAQFKKQQEEIRAKSRRDARRKEIEMREEAVKEQRRKKAQEMIEKARRKEAEISKAKERAAQQANTVQFEADAVERLRTRHESVKWAAANLKRATVSSNVANMSKAEDRNAFADDSLFVQDQSDHDSIYDVDDRARAKTLGLTGNADDFLNHSGSWRGRLTIQEERKAFNEKERREKEQQKYDWLKQKLSEMYPNRGRSIPLGSTPRQGRRGDKTPESRPALRGKENANGVTPGQGSLVSSPTISIAPEVGAKLGEISRTPTKQKRASNTRQIPPPPQAHAPIYSSQVKPLEVYEREEAQRKRDAEKRKKAQERAEARWIKSTAAEKVKFMNKQIVDAAKFNYVIPEKELMARTNAHMKDREEKYYQKKADEAQRAQRSAVFGSSISDFRHIRPVSNTKPVSNASSLEHAQSQVSESPGTKTHTSTAVSSPIEGINVNDQAMKESLASLAAARGNILSQPALPVITQNPTYNDALFDESEESEEDPDPEPVAQPVQPVAKIDESEESEEDPDPEPALRSIQPVANVEESEESEEDPDPEPTSRPALSTATGNPAQSTPHPQNTRAPFTSESGNHSTANDDEDFEHELEAAFNSSETQPQSTTKHVHFQSEKPEPSIIRLYIVTKEHQIIDHTGDPQTTERVDIGQFTDLDDANIFAAEELTKLLHQHPRPTASTQIYRMCLFNGSFSQGNSQTYITVSYSPRMSDAIVNNDGKLPYEAIKARFPLYVYQVQTAVTYIDDNGNTKDARELKDLYTELKMANTGACEWMVAFSKPTEESLQAAKEHENLAAECQEALGGLAEGESFGAEIDVEEQGEGMAWLGARGVVKFGVEVVKTNLIKGPLN